jgi:hypothetical protein
LNSRENPCAWSVKIFSSLLLSILLASFSPSRA